MQDIPYDFAQGLLRTLKEARNIEISGEEFSFSGLFYDTFSGVEQLLSRICDILGRQCRPADEQAMRHVLDLCTSDRELGGLGLGDKAWNSTDHEALQEVTFLTEAWLAAVDSQAAARGLPEPLKHKNAGTCPLNLAEKILAHHAFSVPRPEGVQAGDLLRVSIDWIIASELSWVGMKHSMTSLNMKPRTWRNDRFWLAGDHTVDPRTYREKHVQELIKGLESAKRDLKMTENQGSNYTIMHTEFVRERAEPGMLVLGSDSHTCSAGAVSALAIGLGAGDVMAGLATGETWFKVPESIRINFTGEPAWYIRGKDVILSILKRLKRNTYAAERIVEFGGPGAKALSCDARFAISNMCTELGAITGIFVPDSITQSFVSGRKRKMYKSHSLYFEPDHDAVYAAVFEINLNEVESFIAIYPSPDQVFPVTECLRMKVDGCFIGACTTTEEDLVLAALVLEAGLKRGLVLADGKRVVVPGSLPIVRNLRKLGLWDIYSRCGYERPAPGCSLCLGIGADVAAAGSHWLSSQNRNFQNRMGKGAIGNICSAATVAASSFSMTLSDPRELLQDVSEAKYVEYLTQCKSWRRSSAEDGGDQEKQTSSEVHYVEPCMLHGPTTPIRVNTLSPISVNHPLSDTSLQRIQSRIYRLGDYVDTDAIIPAPACVSSPSDETLGSHCFEVMIPDFRDHVRAGQKVVVGGKAFGCGSSREEAPRALKGLGIQCVIAKSFSFIFGRNMPNIGMLAITITDDTFYEAADHGQEIEIDVQRRHIHVAGKAFPFSLSDMELRLICNKGLASSFQKFGNEVFATLCRKETSLPASVLADLTLQTQTAGSRGELAW